MNSPPGFERNIARFTGLGDLYDQHRPGPPAVLAELISRISDVPRPETVVDLGSGTGLSTRYWADKAGRAIGIEPTPDMRRRAQEVTAAPNVVYRAGLSHQTGLPSQCAQVVVCVQALHWMEPDSTFAEVARILAPGGVFAACDFDFPPATGCWEADEAFAAGMRAGRALEKKRRIDAGVQHWDKNGHFARMQACGLFRHVRDLAVHHEDEGDADRLIGLFLSQGYIFGLLQAGLKEKQLGLARLRAIAQRTLGARPRRFLWSARVRLGRI